MKKEKKQEFVNRITQANRSALVVVLYDITIEYIKDAKTKIQNNKEDYKEELYKARECVKELLGALDFTYEISKELSRLYLYVNRCVTKAIAKKDAEGLDSALYVLEHLRESFAEIAKKDTSECLMGNTQEVYAGLTYGKEQLNESLSGQDNRGFLA